MYFKLSIEERKEWLGSWGKRYFKMMTDSFLTVGLAKWGKEKWKVGLCCTSFLPWTLHYIPIYICTTQSDEKNIPSTSIVLRLSMAKFICRIKSDLKAIHPLIHGQTISSSFANFFFLIFDDFSNFWFHRVPMTRETFFHSDIVPHSSSSKCRNYRFTLSNKQYTPTYSIHTASNFGIIE